MWTLLSRSPLLIEIPATVVQAPPPLGPDVHPEEESTHLEQCPPKLASHGAWETGMFPSPHSGAQGLRPWDSFHHSLCAIHKQPFSPPSTLPPTQTLIHKHNLLLSPLLHIQIYIFHLSLYWHSGAMWAWVPSLQPAGLTACATCHCWRNKGVRCDTCPCYTPLCIFDVSAFPPGQRSVSDKLHTIGNTFLNIVQEPAAISQAPMSLKLPIVTPNFIFIMSLFSIMRLWGKFCPCWKCLEQKWVTNSDSICSYVSCVCQSSGQPTMRILLTAR